MAPIIATLATAAGLFAGTNIDDMVVLAVLNASRSADGRPKAWQIWTGQASGIALLVLISLQAALGLRLLPEGWIWLLGLVPISFGVHGYQCGRMSRGQNPTRQPRGVLPRRQPPRHVRPGMGRSRGPRPRLRLASAATLRKWCPG